MGAFASVYEDSDMYGVVYSTFDAPSDGSESVAVVEIPDGLTIMGGDSCPRYVRAELGGIYELDAEVDQQTYMLNLVDGGDEQTPAMVKLARMTLTKLRMRAGLTQVELAEKIGTTQSQVSDWERGRNSLSIASCAKIAKALDVSPSVVFDVCLAES